MVLLVTPDVGTVFYGGPGHWWSGLICSRFWFCDPFMICSRLLVSSCNNHASTHELLVSSFIEHALVPSCSKSWYHLAFIMIRIHFDPDVSVFLHCNASYPWFVLLYILVSSCIINHALVPYCSISLDLSCINHASYSDFILLLVLIITNGSYSGFMLLLALASFGFIHFWILILFNLPWFITKMN